MWGRLRGWCKIKHSWQTPQKKTICRGIFGRNQKKGMNLNNHYLMEKTPAKPQVSLDFLITFVFVKKSMKHLALELTATPGFGSRLRTHVRCWDITVGASGGYESWFAKMKKPGAPKLEDIDIGSLLRDPLTSFPGVKINAQKYVASLWFQHRKASSCGDIFWNWLIKCLCKNSFGFESN